MASGEWVGQRCARQKMFCPILNVIVYFKVRDGEISAKIAIFNKIQTFNLVFFAHFEEMLAFCSFSFFEIWPFILLSMAKFKFGLLIF